MKKNTSNTSIQYPTETFTLAPIPRSLNAAWQPAMALGLLTASSAVMACAGGGYNQQTWFNGAGGPAGNNGGPPVVSNQTVASGVAFNVRSRAWYNGNGCGVRAKVGYISGGCSGGSVGWSGQAAVCSCGGDVNMNFTMNGAPGATCVVRAEGTTTCGDWRPVDFTVKCGTPVITFNNPGAKVLTGGPTALVGSSTYGLTVVYTSATPAVCTVAGSTLTHVSVGNCTINANVPAQLCYLDATQVQQTFAITQGTQSIAFGANPGPVTFANTTFAVTTTRTPPGAAPVTPAGALTYTSTTLGVCTIAGTTVTIGAAGKTAGSCTITVSAAADANYSNVATASQTISINKATQTITFGANPGPRAMSAGTFAVSATLAPPGPAPMAPTNALVFTSTTLGVCTIAGTTVTPLTSGSCTITANNAADGNYNVAATATQTISLTKGTQTITFGANPGPKALSAGPFAVTTTLSPAGPTPTAPTAAVVYTSTTTGVCTISGSTVTIVTAGSCTITANNAADANYNVAATATQTISITTGSQTITFGANPGPKVFTDAPFAVTTTRTPSVSPPTLPSAPVVYTSTTTGVCTVNAGGTVTIVTSGSCTITANAAADANYTAAATASQTISINKGTQTITFGANPGPKTLGNPPFAVTTTLSPAGPVPTAPTAAVIYTSTSLGVCTISGSTVTIVTAGSCTITANNAADGNYSAAAEVQQVITISVPPPDHYRLEFDRGAAMTCQPLPITAKACINTTIAEPACTTLAPGPTLTASATRYVGGAPVGDSPKNLSLVAGSAVWSLTSTTAGGVNLAIGAQVPAATNTTLECYNTDASSAAPAPGPVTCTGAPFGAVDFVNCSGAFDAVEVGASAGTQIYTKLAGVDFSYDAVGPRGYAGTFVTDFVSNTALGCSTGAGTLSGQSASSSFVAGRKTFTITNFNNAARRAWVRINAGGSCLFSTDSFSIRPTELLLTPNNSAIPMVAGTSGTAPPATGFTLTATAMYGWSGGTTSVGVVNGLGAGYDGSPIMDTSKFWTLTGTSNVNPADLTGGTAFPVADGTSAVTSTIYYNNFGKVIINKANSTDSVVDQSFTVIDAAAGDCWTNSDSYTNTITGGKYGCYIPNSRTASESGRFRPDHYDMGSSLVSRTSTSSCLSYVGTTLGGAPNDGSSVSLRVLAKSAAGNTMTLLNNGSSSAPTIQLNLYDFVNATSATLVSDLELQGPNGATTAITATWTAGAITMASLATSSTAYNIAIKAGNSPPRPPHDALSLGVVLTGTETATFSACQEYAQANPGVKSSAANTATCSPPTQGTTRVRQGILKLENAYGSESLPLQVGVQALFWQTGGGWALNTIDSCTPLSAANVALGNYKGQFATTTTDVTLPAFSATTLTGGRVNLRFAKPATGKTGSFDVAINLGTVAGADVSCLLPTTALQQASTAGARLVHLRGAWCNGTALAKDPSAHITFGASKSPYLYRRERY